ncbi:DUF3014 domain-containing protein [Pseudothauera rhizosphaerae]|uniref:DUF3014 domain-containing protein n=1 Tax=Pseudothauera rhizosphaerae TaxID=2565932 RepID=A0A4S4AC79_9RHOO|nr:DUF3014 domain-containing protein [Pseudothauera rhizosphaerae]THF56572.1 DUF3014 domain-containing protein [Pseudothauera rhizosphaerae]
MRTNEGERSGRKLLPYLGLVLVAAVIGAVVAWLWRQETSVPEVVQPAPQPPAVAPAPDLQPGIGMPGAIQPERHFPPPVAEPEEGAPPLPPLDDSDAAFGEVLSGLAGDSAGLLIVNHLVRRIVVTVDNLPGNTLPVARAPLRQAEGAFRVSGAPDALVIAPDNAARYSPYVRLAEAVPADRLVALYARFYPLFQAAWEELGYPGGTQFNDRLMAVIDQLIATPEVRDPIPLVQPRVRYRFADERLEALPAGQKIMIRMGADNAVRIKAKLREIRVLLAGAGRRG